MEVWWFPTLHLTTSASSSVSRRPTETKSNREPQESDTIGLDKNQQSFTGLFLPMNQILTAQTKDNNNSQVCFLIRYYRLRQKPPSTYRFGFESDTIGPDKIQQSFTGLLLNQILSGRTKSNNHSQVCFYLWIRYYWPRQKPTIIHRFTFESDNIGPDKNRQSFTGLLLNQIL